MSEGTPAEAFARSLDALREDHLLRTLRPLSTHQGPDVASNGVELLQFASNDYLGLANHPSVLDAAIEAVRKFGAGSGSSRLLAGSLQPHHALEERLADFKKAEAALAFNSGYAAATGCLQAVVGKGDVVLLDRLAHACLIDGARLSGATLRVFPHNDMERLDGILSRLRGVRKEGRILIVTESVFSMDGDVCPLPELIALKEKYGAWLFVDEAHATGVLGSQGRGWADQCRLADRVDFQMGTLGKALGSAGGYLCGSRSLVDYLINRARSFIFSTAPPPAQAAAAIAAINIASGPEGDTLRATLRSHMAALGESLPAAGNPLTPIIPIHLGDESRALEIEARLRALAIWVPAIRYPTVSKGSARLRISLTAAHRPEHIDTLAAALAPLL